MNWKEVCEGRATSNSKWALDAAPDFCSVRFRPLVFVDLFEATIPSTIAYPEAGIAEVSNTDVGEAAFAEIFV